MRKNDLNDLLADAFNAPEPKNKKEFLKTIRPREVSTMKMLVQQASYIRISVWLLAAAIIILAIAGSLAMIDGTEKTIASLMPFTAAIAVLEMKRSVKYNMIELEMATRYSLRSVVLARLSVIGLVAMIVLLVSAPVIAAAFGGEVIYTAMHILIPYLITMIVSLRIERTIAGRQTGYTSLAVAAIVAMSIYWASFNQWLIIRLLEAVEKWGVAITLILIALTVMEQWKTINNVEAFA
ncbi:MAG: hypothetical protein J5509_12025 [Lachnospiraceae bacterium]|nr:hypothetical protein [Lachnospiraceae bacterium]